MRGRNCVLLGAVVVMIGALYTVAAMPAAADVPGMITLQGKLTDGSGNIVPNGNYPVTFRIYDNAGPGGTILWSEVTSVTTNDGLFTKLMGSVTPVPDSVFNNPDRWLGIQVTGNAEMFPRTQLSAVGWAKQSAQWNSTGQNVYRPTGRVGIGTATPGVPLHIAAGEPVMVLQDTGAASTQSGYLGFWDATPTETGWLGFGNPPSPEFRIQNSRPSGDIVLQTGAGADLIVGSSGSVGIGAAPIDSYKLFVSTNGQAAVRGSNGSSDGDGVVGITDGINGYGIWGLNTAGGEAGNFDGAVDVNGTLSKNAGSFKIDHPLDPANKYLSHSFVESPDMMNIYNGNVTLDASGQATVQLPEWFGALNKDFRYQLTCIGGYAQIYVAEKVEHNHFKIAGGTAGLEVSWQVTGIRQDAYAKAHRIPVEELKPERERGHYRNPELFSQPEEKGVEWARKPEIMKQMKDAREKATEEQ